MHVLFFQLECRDRKLFTFDYDGVFHSQHGLPLLYKGKDSS